MATTTVRLTFWPDKDVEVDEAELANLRSQGLLIEDDEQSETGPPEADPDPDATAKTGAQVTPSPRRAARAATSTSE